MNDLLKVAMIQADILWEDSRANLKRYRELLKGMAVHPDLIIFPEMFTTGFSVNPEQNAEQMSGESVSWLAQMAGDLDSSLAGSLIIEENKRYFNRFVLIDPEGEVRYYDKRHLFWVGNEESHYHRGSERKIFKLGEWRICPQICYDLRFPVWSRNQNDYDLLIYVASWPESRRDAWKTLLKARAIENLSYCIGVNRVGTDGRGICYAGESMVVNGKGQILNNVRADSEDIIISGLSLPELRKLRNDFPAYKDADRFQLE
ncbi:MAG TPA: amidohydrolase [Bacteroidales bacterium]|nr:amidohydrolase [Bacteroidales bacterium]